MKKYQTILLCISCLVLNSRATGVQGGWIVGWGYNAGGEATGIPPITYTTNWAEMETLLNNPKVAWQSTGTVAIAGQIVSNITAISCGSAYSFALKNDGSVVSWGMAGWGTNRGTQFTPPVNLLDLRAITAGEMHNLALKKDGTVLVWGEKRYGALNIPEGLSNVVAVAASGNNSLALNSNGTLSGWGASIRIPPGLSNIVAISASPAGRLGIGRQGDALALKQDGTVIDIEWSDSGSRASAIGGLSNIVAIAAGPVHNLALKKDGTIFAWGFDGNGELNEPAGLSNVVAIAASGSSFPARGYSLALKRDGTLVAWGKIGFQPATVPAGLSNVVAIAAGENYCLAITTNRAVAERFR